VPGVLAQSQADHADIAAALAARDADWAERATETHMRNVYLSTREAMEKAK
jgi:DNA-binding FadR family transcriptional regulator